MTWEGYYRGRPVSGAVIVERPTYRHDGLSVPLPRPPAIGSRVTVVGTIDGEGNCTAVFDDGRVEELHWTTTLPVDDSPALFRVDLMQRLIEYFDDFFDAVETYASLLAREPGTKVCTRCGTERLMEDFHTDAREWDGLYRLCKKCRA